MSAIVVEGVSKCFRVYEKPADHLKEILTFGRRRFHTEFWALRDVSFSLEKGECLGIIGENGSGKSTLLRIVAGVVRPNSGTVAIDGRVSALLELGAGFNPEFTGRDNVVLNASILGLSDSEIRSKMPMIEEFAGIGDFVDRPVKTYSSGMLIVDEALAVGDIYFQQRCIRAIQALKAQGVTILFVSHDLSSVRTLADSTIWMDHGRVRMLGPTDDVAAEYMAAMIAKGNRELMDSQPVGEAIAGSMALEVHAEALDRIPEFINALPNVDRRFGNGRARIVGIGIFDYQGNPTGSAAQGDRVCVRVSVEFLGEVSKPNVGFMLRNRLGEDVFGTNLLYEGQQMTRRDAGDRVSVDFVMDLPYLRAGYYHFSPAVADGSMDNYEHCDWVDNAFALEIVERSTTYGHIRVPVATDFRIVSDGGEKPGQGLKLSEGGTET